LTKLDRFISNQYQNDQRPILHIGENASCFCKQ